MEIPTGEQDQGGEGGVAERLTGEGNCGGILMTGRADLVIVEVLMHSGYAETQAVVGLHVRCPSFPVQEHYSHSVPIARITIIIFLKPHIMPCARGHLIVTVHHNYYYA